MSNRYFKPALGLRKLKSLALIELAKLIIKKLTSNLSVPLPNPPLADLTTLTNEYETARLNLEKAKIELKECASIEKKKRKLLERGLSTEARTVEIASLGSKAIIESCGMPASQEPQRVHLGQVTGLVLKHSENPGCVNASWDAILRAKTYTIRISHTAPDEHGMAAWEFYDNSSKASALLSGLQRGSGLWVNVCANGHRNKGGFSDPAFIIVP